MNIHYPELAERVLSQRTSLPKLYGKVDFEKLPHRFTVDPSAQTALPEWVAKRGPVLEDPRAIELMRITTMLGDVVADPYAALIETHGVRGLVDMLKRACREGIDAVPEAPPELRALIDDMETIPDWLDMEMVEEGARHSRIAAAFIAPFLIRGVFLATFLNSYSALPMALTGTLSGRRAAYRINETASYFAVTTLPRALQRRGPGFEATAMVRLMHSVVRYNALTRPDLWDVSVYGVPIPQIDQMPAGLINMYLAAMSARRLGRYEFDERERAMLEFSRYRCYLLGLPEELLPTTPHEIIHVFHARAATLRDGFDETCEKLVRSTMAAYVRKGRTPVDRAIESVEKSWSKAFILGFCGGDRKAAEAMGVDLRKRDLARVALTLPAIVGRFAGVVLADRQPLLRKAADIYTTHVVAQRLASYGRPEFISDPKTYRAAV